MKYKQGLPPHLLMFGQQGTDQVDRFPIGGWTEDTIAEYLDDNLAKPDEAA